MTTYSVLAPLAPSRPERMLPFAAFVQWSGTHRLWQGQSTVCENGQAFAFAAASGFRTPVGTGVHLMPFHHPFAAAMQAQALACTIGHPVVAGFGPGGTELQRNLLGSPYRSQLGAVREYATIVRTLLDGEPVDHDGEFFACRAGLPPVRGPRVELGLGVLRPAMARLAGEVADVAITWLTPAAYLRDVVIPALRDGARAAGRPTPRVAAMVPLAVDGPDRSGPRLALASNAGHMSAPHYVDMLRRSGIDVDMSDPETSAANLVKGEAFLFGGPDFLAESLDAYREAGVEEVVLNVSGVCATRGAKAALDELKTIDAEVLSRLSPRAAGGRRESSSPM
jgi:5,10-methylenetetrahydromethanopterin reductase